MTGFVTAGEGSDALLGPAAHDLLDHTAGPLSLLDVTAHDLLNHAGLTGVPAAEAFTAGVHAGTGHAGLSGIDLRSHLVNRAVAAGGSISFNPSTLPFPFVPVVLISFLQDTLVSFMGTAKGTGALQGSVNVNVFGGPGGFQASALSGTIFGGAGPVSVTSFTPTLVTVSGPAAGGWGGTVIVFGNRT